MQFSLGSRQPEDGCEEKRVDEKFTVIRAANRQLQDGGNSCCCAGNGQQLRGRPVWWRRRLPSRTTTTTTTTAGGLSELVSQPVRLSVRPDHCDATSCSFVSSLCCCWLTNATGSGGGGTWLARRNAEAPPLNNNLEATR